MNNISLGFSGDGFTVAENPIRDTLFAGNPELYYTIGNASTMISAMALPMSGILKGATGATKFKTIAVDAGRILIGNVAEDKAYDAIYQSTDSRILAMLGSNVVEEVLSGKPANSSVSEIGDVARRTDIEELSHTTIFKNSDDIALGEKALSNVEVNKLDDVAEVVEGGSGSEIYTSVEYEGTVKVNGEVRDVSRKVYQRNDIDFEYFDETTGLTNLERMQAGKPPIGTDGNAIQLHHILQKEAGPMVEIREITHQEYYSQLHGLIEDGASFRNDPILNKQYNNFRRSYWKWRAEQIVGGK